MPASEAQKRASAKYAKKNTIRIGLAWNTKTDADIIARLESLEGESRQSYIRRLIRQDIAQQEKREAAP